MTRMTGGRAVVEALKVEGIEHVFGIVGTHSVHLFDGLAGQNGLRLVTPRHEQGASMMAAGYARASGKIAACFTVPGPGLTNALTGLGMAYSESAPVLIVTGQNALPLLDREGEYFHELRNSLAVAGSLCGHTARVSRPEDVPAAVREAVRAMRLRRPRPAFIEVPLDVSGLEADIELLPQEQSGRPGGDPAAVERAAQALQSAKRPFIFAGGGVASAEGAKPLQRLAELLGAPVATSAYAKGVLSDRHRLALGDGWGRLDIYDEILSKADVALIVGSRLDLISDAQQGARFPKRIVQIDIDPVVVGQRRAVEVGIVGDAALVMNAIADQLPNKPGGRECWLDVVQFKRGKRARLAELAGSVLPLTEDLRAALPDETIFVDDLTLVGYWAPALLDCYRPRTLLHAGTYGTLGYALPAAIGAKIACPNQPVVAICGDGGFLYTLQELATARAENLDLIVLVFNDNAFGALKTYQDRHFRGRRVGADLTNPDFLKLGEAFGVQSVRVEAAQIGATVRTALEGGGTWLIEIPFAPDPPASIPPWMA